MRIVQAFPKAFLAKTGRGPRRGKGVGPEGRAAPVHDRRMEEGNGGERCGQAARDWTRASCVRRVSNTLPRIWEIRASVRFIRPAISRRVRFSK